MERVIEVLIFLTPFIAFAAWRILLPSPVPPRWLLLGMAGFVVVMLIALLWLRQVGAEDKAQAYIPDELRDGVVVPGHPAP